MLRVSELINCYQFELFMYSQKLSREVSFRCIRALEGAMNKRWPFHNLPVKDIGKKLAEFRLPDSPCLWYHDTQDAEFGAEECEECPLSSICWHPELNGLIVLLAAWAFVVHQRGREIEHPRWPISNLIEADEDAQRVYRTHLDNVLDEWSDGYVPTETDKLKLIEMSDRLGQEIPAYITSLRSALADTSKILLEVAA